MYTPQYGQFMMQSPYAGAPAQAPAYFLQSPNIGAFQQPGYLNAQNMALTQKLVPLGQIGQQMMAMAGPHLGNGQPLTQGGAQNLGFSRMPPMGAYNAGKQLAMTNPPLAQSLLSMAR